MALYYFGNHPHAKGKDGQKINTRAHYDYICRQGSYANMKGKKEDLVFACSGNMPAWSKDAGDFWSTAEEHRQSNGRAYREIRMGLQEELSLDDNIALVEEFLKESGIGKNHAFSYAVHDKVAAFDSDHHNIHCHLMFCEKSIEKDRPLDRNMYFKHYYLNRAGEPCAGYKVDSYYQKRQCTIEMRKMWADIVNRKFRELGIDKEVSEKSLAAQRQDLLAQGRVEEAEKLDRIPAPHLGEAYKNPKTLEKIRERIEEIDRQTQFPGCSQDEADATDDQDSIMEQKIVCFATDKLLRRIMKEIEQEERRIRKEEILEMEAKLAAEEDDDEAEELASEPIVVTAGDVCDSLKSKAKEEAKKQAEKLALYRETKKQIVPERLFRNIAIEKIIGSDYHNLKKRYQRVLDELKPMRQKYIELANVPYEQKMEFDHAYSEKLRQEQAMRKQLNEYNDELSHRKDDIQAITKELAAENENIQKKAKRIYVDVIKAKKMEALYLKKADELKENVPDADTVLYSRQLPKMVMRHCQLNGTTPLKQLELVAHNERAYVILNDMPAAKNEPKKKTALLLGDTVKKGKADVYLLTMDDKGKEVAAVAPTNEQVCLYGSAGKTMNRQNGQMRRGPGNHYQPKTQAAQQQRNAEITGKISQFMEKAVEDTHGRYRAWWDDEDHSKKKDELERVEEEMYRGWSM